MGIGQGGTGRPFDYVYVYVVLFPVGTWEREPPLPLGKAMSRPRVRDCEALRRDLDHDLDQDQDRQGLAARARLFGRYPMTCVLIVPVGSGRETCPICTAEEMHEEFGWRPTRPLHHLTMLQ